MTIDNAIKSPSTPSHRELLIKQIVQSAVSLNVKPPISRRTKQIPPKKRKLDGLAPTKKNPKNERPSTAKLLSDERSKVIDSDFIQHDVSTVYQLIHKRTGALGGNGAGGAIYGEITKNSMGKIIEYLETHCELTDQSVFLDIGSGLGKPNFHAAVTPGVAISYGVELEDQRWELSLYNLQCVLKSSIQSKVRPVIFTQGDINNAETLDPFTHVYSFDVGFPPAVMAHIAECFNESNEPKYYISFHNPKKVIEQYGFDVEEIGKLSTSMAGSSEGHSVYFYQRVLDKDNLVQSKSSDKIKIDPIFCNGFHIVQQGHDKVIEWIDEHITRQRSFGRTRRQLQLAKTLVRAPQEKTLDQYYRRVQKNKSIVAK